MRNEFKKTVAVFDLPCGPLARHFANGYTGIDPRKWSEEDKRAFYKRKGANEELLKETEDMKDDDIMARFAEQCRGLHTHFAYFSTIADTAIRNNWTIGYATYRKRMKKEDIEKEHKSIQNWLHKNGKDTMTAVSIGWGKRGYVYVFFVSTSSNGVAVGDIGTAFYQNRRRKGYTPVECRPFEKNPYSFLESHYCTPLRDDMDLTPFKVRECVSMIRSSFALRGKNKTLRTQEAIANMYNYMHLAELDEVCEDIRKFNIFNQTNNLLLDWTEDKEWIEYVGDKDDIEWTKEWREEEDKEWEEWEEEDT